MSRTNVPPPVTRVLDVAQTWLPRRMASVEERLRDLAAGHGEPLRGEAAATLAAGGKRLRPLLVLLCAGSDAGHEAERAAVAIELVHMATLVHDDVLDQAPLRRGRPTVVARSGRSIATAVGDMLFARAFAELAGSGAGAERRVALLADAATALARGELAQRRDAFDVSISAERYLERCTLKTARLFECACRIGTGDDDRELASFGDQVGLAFQLLDDVLDVSGPPERTGKARGTDLLDGTVTLPFIVARERDPALAEVDLRGLDERGAEQLCERIAASGALEEVRADATDRVERAKVALSASSLDPERRELLALVADGVVERYA
ncbi:MAG TPA: polyprenyl synthetase family protein [Solirubrobacterales bacterium]|nr:polyprenyl synthetase family protein [Solirubrobacterales bacterium]